MQSAKAKYVPALSIRVLRAKTGRWEDYGTVGAVLSTVRRLKHETARKLKAVIEGKDK